MNYAVKRSSEEEAYDTNKNTKKKKSLSEKKAKSIEDNTKEINAAEINIGFKCYKCGQCNFQTLHKKSLVHHNSFAHNIKLFNAVVKKQSEEKIDVTVEDQTKDIMIDEGPLMSSVIVEDQFENNMEDEGSPCEEQIDSRTIVNSQQIKKESILLKEQLEEKIGIDDVKTSHFCNSDSDTLNETMSSLPDISRSNSMERKSYSTSPSKSFIKNEQSVEILDMGELFPHLPVDIDSPKSLRKHSLELSKALKEENQIIEDTTTISIGLTPICSETDLSQSSSATHEEILPMIKREEAGEIINNEPRIKREEAGEIIKNEERVKREKAGEIINNEARIKREEAGEIIKNEERVKREEAGEIIYNEPRIKREEAGEIIKNEERVKGEAEKIIKNEPRLKREIVIKNEPRINREKSKKAKNEPRIKREEGGVIYSACPLCFKHWMMEELELHASECLGGGKEEIILDGTGEEVKDGGHGNERFLCGYCSTSVHEGEDEKLKHLISCRKNMAMKKWQEARQEKKNALRSRYKKEV